MKKKLLGIKIAKFDNLTEIFIIFFSLSINIVVRNAD